jgi:SAM-dependent methyltransferase
MAIKEIKMNYLKKIYKSQQFNPRWLGLFINPFYFARKYLYLAILKYSHFLVGDLLDVGCGNKPYQENFNVKSYKGLDIDTPLTRIRAVADDFYDGHVFPYTSNQFDSVLTNQVLEHVFNPDQFLQEINRVLKFNGKLLLTAPFLWDEHEQPYDYARYSSFGLKALLEKNGFSIISHEKLGANATILFQLTNAYLFKIIKSWPIFARIIFTITVMAFINIAGLIIGKILPSNSDLYLDNIILAEKIS